MARNNDIYSAFKAEFKAARTKVYKEYGVSGRASLKDVIDVMVEAAYQNLVDVILAKFILEGKIVNGAKLPREVIRDREAATTEILSVMGTDLQMLDPKHDYSVGIMKRERKTNQI